MTELEKITLALQRDSLRRGGDGALVTLPVVEPPTPQSVNRRGPCKFLGTPIPDKTVTCPTCKGGTRQLPVYECKVYGECQPVTKVNDLACCRLCTTYAERDREGTNGSSNRSPITTHAEYVHNEAITTRHLVYHILPVSANGVWRRGIDQLRLRWNLFNGRKIFTVATGGPVRERVDNNERIPKFGRTLPLDSVSTVSRYLPKGSEVIEVPNDIARWELSGWDVVWPQLFTTAQPSDVVFYGHAKGSTRKVESPCQVWADLLYRICLDHWTVTSDVLATRPLAGGLVKFGKFFPPPNQQSMWHYPGNFWWARAGVLRERLEHYARYLVSGHSAEAWVGMAYGYGEAGSIFSPKKQLGFLYSPSEITEAVASYSKWLDTHVPETYELHYGTGAPK